MRAWLAAACVACATLSGCGLFSDDSKRVPTPLVDFKATMAPRVSWSTSVGSSGIYNLAPAIVGTAVYAASVDGNVVRIDATNGSSKWRSSVDLKISAGVAANDDLVVVGGPDGDVVALDAASGKQRWAVKVPGELYGTPVIAGSLVVLRSSDARLFALDLGNGARAWTLQRPLPSLVLRADAGMTAYGETLLASFPGGRLLAVSLKTGTVRFDAAVASPKGTTELERIADVVGTPALDGNDACVAAYQGRIACVNAQTGSVLWGREFSSPLSVAADAAMCSASTSVRSCMPSCMAAAFRCGATTSSRIADSARQPPGNARWWSAITRAICIFSAATRACSSPACRPTVLQCVWHRVCSIVPARPC